MSKGKKKQKQPFTVKDPVTGKTYPVQRELQVALERLGKLEMEKQAKDGAKISKTITNKYYSGQTKNVQVNFKFDDKGAVQIDNPEGRPQLSLRGELETLDANTKQLIKEALFELVLATNEAISKQNADVQEKFDQVYGEYKQAAQSSAA